MNSIEIFIHMPSHSRFNIERRYSLENMDCCSKGAASHTNKCLVWWIWSIYAGLCASYDEIQFDKIQERITKVAKYCSGSALITLKPNNVTLIEWMNVINSIESMKKICEWQRKWRSLQPQQKFNSSFWHEVIEVHLQ